MKQISNDEFNIALKNKDNQAIIGTLKKKYRKYIPQEELHTCCMTALWKSLSKFDINKGGKPQKFTTYLYQHIIWECCKWIKNDKYERSHNYKELDENISYSQIMYDEFKDIISGMPQPLAIVLEQKFVYNMTYQEIGKKNNYSNQTAKNRLTDGLKYIKNARTMYSES